jgi:hypothetical protein
MTAKLHSDRREQASSESDIIKNNECFAKNLDKKG